MSRSSTLAALAIATFAGVHSAHGALIVREYNQSLDNGVWGTTNSANTLFDINLDGINDFLFTHTTSAGGPGGSPSNPQGDYNGQLLFTSATPTQFLAVVKDTDNATSGNSFSPIGNYAEILFLGSLVGPGNVFIEVSPGPSSYDSRLLDSQGTGNGGAFSVASGERNPLVSPTTTAYIGFAFGDPANPFYGWAEFTQIGNDDRPPEGDRNAATLSRVVYSDVAGVPVVVGAVPEPTTLLAGAGLAGLTLARRRRLD